MHGSGLGRRSAARVLRAGLALAVCATLLGGLWPRGECAAVSPGAPVPFEAWRTGGDTGPSRSLGYPARRTAWGLVEFAPAADIDITRIEFWTIDATTDVDVYLYDSFDGTSLGIRLASKLNSAFDQAGFHAVSLDAPVPATGGDEIVAVVKITNATRGHPLLLDSEDRGGRLRAFASPDGASGSWYDVGAGGHGTLAIYLGAGPSGADQVSPGQQRVFLPLVASHHVASATGWTVIVEEDFEGAFPGEWLLHDGDPAEGLHVMGPRACRAYSGSFSGWVVGDGAGAALGCQSAYPRYVESWMVYGPFSLANASAAQLAFQLWLNSEPEYDGVFSGASIDGVEFHGFTASGNSAGWQQQVLNLRSVPGLGDLTGQEEVWIALLFVSDGVVRMQQGAFIDDIVLRKYVGSPEDLQEEIEPAMGGTAQRKEAAFSLHR